MSSAPKLSNTHGGPSCKPHILNCFKVKSADGRIICITTVRSNGSVSVIHNPYLKTRRDVNIEEFKKVEVQPIPLCESLSDTLLPKCKAIGEIKREI